MQHDQGTVDIANTDSVIEPEALGSHDAVVTALANHHEQLGHKTHQLWVGDLGSGVSAMWDLYVEDIQRVYDVKTVDTLISVDPGRFGPWRQAGYDTWIVVPADRLTNVRRRVEGHVDHIQTWAMKGTAVTFAEVGGTTAPNIET